MEEINIKDLYDIIFKRKWLIIAVTFLCTAAGIFYSFFIAEEIYEASVTIIISSQKNNQELSALTYNDYNLNVKLTESYRTLCKTDRVLNQVINKAELSLTLRQLADKITVSPVSNTELINISVKDTVPLNAKNIADTLADIFQREVVSIMKMDNVQIIDYAVLPASPVKPNKSLNTLISLFIGGIIGIGIVFLIEMLDVTIKDVNQVEKVLGTPVLGSIPKIEGIKTDKDTISGGYARAAFDKIKINIDYTCIDNKSKSIIISSAVPTEGKTIVSVNTAVSMAQNGHKTLLVDADMHKPYLHKLLGIANINGLSNIIAGKLDWKSKIKEVNIPNLHVITSGRRPPNPAELLGSKWMKEFVNEIEGEYDYIIFDTPPMLPVSDVASFMKNANSIIIVSKYGFSNINALKQVKKILCFTKADIIGAVFNSVPKKGYEYDYGYGYGYERNQEGRNNIKNLILSMKSR